MTAPNTAEQLISEARGLRDDVQSATKTLNDKYTALHAEFDGVKKAGAEQAEKVAAAIGDFTKTAGEVQQLRASLDSALRQMQAPVVQGGDKLRDADRKNAIELQRRAHVHKFGNDTDFRADPDTFVNFDDLRSAVRKMMAVGLVSKKEARSKMTDAERRAMDNASLDQALFVPEMLGYEEDCNVECAYLDDIYGQVGVTKSTFMHPVVLDYGAIGQYTDDARCDAEYGPAGNISYKQGKTYDFRGVFCFQKKVLQEANYDLLGFMVRSAQRSHRINRNRARMVGDGVKEPLGWQKADVFAKFETPATALTHIDVRRFLVSFPREYGNATAVLHQNTLGYIMSMTDADGRFLFGDGSLAITPEDLAGRIRISNCLTDPTEGNTKGSAGAPFTAGAFVMALANWDMAYKAVNKRSMFMEQWLGEETAWCVKYQFGAEDGGFVGCPAAGRTLVIG